MAVKPIKPSEIDKVKDSLIPEEVVQVINDLIVENWNGSYAEFTLSKAAERIAAVLDIKEDAVYSRHLLDIEKMFEQVGWHVVYDRPGYNEDYPATFKFSRKQKG